MYFEVGEFPLSITDKNPHGAKQPQTWVEEPHFRLNVHDLFRQNSETQSVNMWKSFIGHLRTDLKTAAYSACRPSHVHEKRFPLLFWIMTITKILNTPGFVLNEKLWRSSWKINTVLLWEMAFWRKWNKNIEGNAESILVTVNEITFVTFTFK